MLRQWSGVMVVAALMAVWMAGPVLAQAQTMNGAAQGAAQNPGPGWVMGKPQGSGSAQTPALGGVVNVDPLLQIGWRNPPMGAGLKGLNVAGVGPALTAWMASYDAKYGPIQKQISDLSIQSYQETDAAKKADLAKQAADLRSQLPTSVQQYALIRETLKGTLTDEQLATVDTNARKYTTSGVVASVESFVKTIEKNSKSSLTDDQKALVAPIEAKAKAAADQLPLGTNLGSKEMMAIVAGANKEIIANVLTDAQRAAAPTPRR